MFWKFQNPIRSLRRFSASAEYTLLPNHYIRRGSVQSQSSDGGSEKDVHVHVHADADDQRDRDRDRDLEKEASEMEGITRRGGRRGWKMLVIFLVFVLVLILETKRRFRIDTASEDGSDLEVIFDEEPDVEVWEEEGITREVYYDSEDPTHVHLSPLNPLPRTRQLLSRPKPNEALWHYLETGEMLSPSPSSLPTEAEADADADADAEIESEAEVDEDLNVKNPDSGSVTPVDIVYLWVNSTDSLFAPAYHARMVQEDLRDEGQARRWRDNGELRGAIRSSVESLGDGLKRVHVVSANYRPEPSTIIKREDDEVEVADQQEEEEEEEEGRLDEVTVGQIPEWLDWTAQEDGTSEKLTWHFHPDIFRLPRDLQGSLIVDEQILGEYELVSDPPISDDNATGESTTLDKELGTESEADMEDHLEEAWRELALPTFNSFAIESRVGWITGLSENFILSNDDMFFLKPMSPLDFHHPLLGPVLRLATQLPVPPHLPASLVSSPGEWGGLQHASLLLSRRFTLRPQAYPEHFPKSLTLGMMDEVGIMFATDLALAGTRGFRESKRGEGDLEMAALASWLRVERWREALLWSWVIGKQGPVWGEKARDEIRMMFGDGLEEGKTVLFRKGRRTTLEDIREKGDQPLETRYKFSSLDGHLPHNVDHPAQTCFFASYCLPDHFLSDPSATYASDEVFKLVAFERPQCGDCLIEALVSASGERGLEAFLPHPETTFAPSSHDDESQSRSTWSDSIPILPLTNDWRTTNFTLPSVLASSQEVNLRQWSLELLSRYVYTVGETPAVFAPVSSARQLSSKLRQVGNGSGVAMLCVNDDVDESLDGQTDQAGLFKYVLGRWMNAKWPTRGEWEREAT